MSYNFNSIIGQNYGANSLFAKINNAITAKKDDKLTADFNKFKVDGLTFEDVLGLERTHNIDLDGDGKKGIVLGVTAGGTPADIENNPGASTTSKEDIATIGKAFQSAGKESFNRTDLQKLASDGTLPNGKKVDFSVQKAATALLNNQTKLDVLDRLGLNGADDGRTDFTYHTSNFINAPENDSLNDPVEDPEDAAGDNPPPEGGNGEGSDKTGKDSVLKTIAGYMNGADIKNFGDAQLEKLAAGEALPGGEKPTQDVIDAAKALQDDKDLKLALDVYGQNGNRDGAIDNAYWTVNLDKNASDVVNTNEQDITGKGRRNGVDGEVLLNGADGETQTATAALQGETETDAATRKKREQMLNRILGVSDLGGTIDEAALNNIKKNGTDQQKEAANYLLEDPSLLAVLGKYKSTDISSQMIYILRFAAAEDKK